MLLTAYQALVLGLTPKLVDMGVGDSDEKVRMRAIGALSSLTRNCQPALDAAWKVLPDEHKTGDKPDASQMAQVDEVIDSLRNASKRISAQNN
jgi:hsp70-interacting protein